MARSNASSVNEYIFCTPKEVKGYLRKILIDGKGKFVPMLHGSPGCGKSQIVKSIFKEMKLLIKDIRLSMHDVTDFTGLPKVDGDKSEFLPFKDLFPTADVEIPKGYEGFGIFLDEFNSAPKEVQAASYRILLDHEVGHHPLHPNTFIVAAGNLESDRAIVNKLGTATKTRLIHIYMKTDYDSWLEEVALKNNYDPRIVAFIADDPSRLDTFNPNNDSAITFAVPRTWEMVETIFGGNTINENDEKLISGIIGSELATNFVQYIKVFDDVISIDEILSSPKACRLPSDSALAYATTMSMVTHVNKSNFEAISEYVNRFNSSQRILFFRAAIMKDSSLKTTKTWIANAKSLAKYLYA